MILFGIHVQKCAGTTLFLRARSQLQFNETYSCTDMAGNFSENRTELFHFNDYSTLKLVFGHFLDEEMLKILPGPIRIFAGLREPRARFRSQLRYMASYRKKRGLRLIDLHEEIKLENNVMCRSITKRFPTLAGEGTLAQRALRVLEHCWCIYFVERFEETTAPIFQALNVAPDETNWNVNQENSSEFDRDAMDLAGAQLDQDIILYETALKRYSMQTEISGFAAGRLAAFRAEPLRAVKLQQSFYRDSFRQYEDDNILDEVIHRRKRLIDELQAELSVYSDLMSDRIVKSKKSID